MDPSLYAHLKPKKLSCGELLYTIEQNSENKKLLKWIEKNIEFPKLAAYEEQILTDLHKLLPNNRLVTLRPFYTKIRVENNIYFIGKLFLKKAAKVVQKKLKFFSIDVGGKCVFFEVEVKLPDLEKGVVKNYFHTKFNGIVWPRDRNFDHHFTRTTADCLINIIYKRETFCHQRKNNNFSLNCYYSSKDNLCCLASLRWVIHEGELFVKFIPHAYDKRHQHSSCQEWTSASECSSDSGTEAKRPRAKRYVFDEREFEKTAVAAQFAPSATGVLNLVETINGRQYKFFFAAKHADKNFETWQCAACHWKQIQCKRKATVYKGSVVFREMHNH